MYNGGIWEVIRSGQGMWRELMMVEYQRIRRIGRMGEGEGEHALEEGRPCLREKERKMACEGGETQR